MMTYSLDPSYTHYLQIGEGIMPRRGLVNTPALASGVVYISYFNALKTEVVNNVKTWTGSTGTSGSTICKIAIFNPDVSQDPGQILQLQSVTANNTSMWANANQQYTQSLPSPGYYKERGVRIAVAVLFIGTTGPSLLGAALPTTTTASSILLAEPRIMAMVSGQTDILSRYSIIGRSIDLCSYSTGSNTLTTTSQYFGLPPDPIIISPRDVGATITGPGIPANTTITAATYPRTITMSQQPTSSQTNVTVTVLPISWATNIAPIMPYVELTP